MVLMMVPFPGPRRSVWAGGAGGQVSERRPTDRQSLVVKSYSETYNICIICMYVYVYPTYVHIILLRGNVREMINVSCDRNVVLDMTCSVGLFDGRIIFVRKISTQVRHRRHLVVDLDVDNVRTSSINNHLPIAKLPFAWN